DMKSFGHYLYSVSECSDGLQVIDLQYLPDSAHLLTVLPTNNTGGFSSHNLSVDSTRGFLYLEGRSENGFNIYIHDISNPEAPVYVTSFGNFATHEIHDMYVINDTAFVADGTSSPTSYSIWDMANKFAPQLITRWSYAGGYAHNIWPNAARSFAATTEETPGSSVKIWNIADVENVQLIGEYFGPGQFAHNAHFKGNDVYLSEYVDGVAVIRVCGDGIEELATFTTLDRNNPAFTADCWGVNPFTNDSLVYASFFDGRLIVLRMREDTSVPIADSDGDGARDGCDNCPGLANPDQADGDGDLVGDACDDCPNDFFNDADNDGLCADVDNCPNDANADQTDSDGDGIGDPCDKCEGFDDSIDSDFDGTPDLCDACPGFDDREDVDSDGVPDACDNCFFTANSGQTDTDGDGVGDACDVCPLDPLDDVDGDGFCADVDNCPDIFNINQTDSDFDGIGNECDDCPGDPINDADGDGSCAFEDNCPLTPNPDQADADGDGVGDVCDICPGFDDTMDTDGDGIPDGCDECPTRPDPCTCCDTAGDADNDGAPNIADVTFNIARIFSGGPAAPCQDEADANGDNSFNIADVTHMISFIFSGGAPPACGSTGL
ncbi:MAG TPA: thrombospondin type 3 repeat-containing protein, partial [candidate division Zixibacteria bacterium]|nr:thrombospondin type 3 repeat-containing protein [candidate division Zixibacteria bacterium]